jgi:L,D-transpeptidase ErfK/SrfK
MMGLARFVTVGAKVTHPSGTSTTRLRYARIRPIVSGRINILRAKRSFSVSSVRGFAGLVAGLFAMPAGATTYELGEGQPVVFGTIEHYTTTYEDTFTDIARRFSLGYEEIARANPGTDPWLPGAGKDLVIPGRRILPNAPQEGIVINLPEHRLYYFPKRKKNEQPIVITYPVSIGKMDWHTPLGETKVVSKQKNPSWYPPDSVRKEHAERGEPLPGVVGPGPDNPLGAYAMRLAITPGAYLIHGTNNPLAVGMAVTHGCMRMYPEDVEALFPLVPVGTKVRIINEPVKTAFVDGQLLLEAHPPVDAEGQTYEPNLELFSGLLDKALGPTTAAVHWDFARETLQVANGLPTVVGLEADLEPPALESVPGGQQPAAATADASSAPAGSPVSDAGGSGTLAAAAQPAASGGASLPASPAVSAVPAETHTVASLPAPLPPPDSSAPLTGAGARAFPAEQPAEATAAAQPPSP